MATRKSTRKKAKSPVAIAIGEVLRSKRRLLRVSQEQFAERVSLSKNYIGNIERGEYEVAISALNRIAAALDTRTSEIIREAGF